MRLGKHEPHVRFSFGKVFQHKAKSSEKKKYVLNGNNAAFFVGCMLLISWWTGTAFSVTPVFESGKLFGSSYGLYAPVIGQFHLAGFRFRKIFLFVYIIFTAYTKLNFYVNYLSTNIGEREH